MRRDLLKQKVSPSSGGRESISWSTRLSRADGNLKWRRHGISDRLIFSTRYRAKVLALKETLLTKDLSFESFVSFRVCPRH